MVRVVTDSTADIPADMIAALGITVIPSYVVFGSESYRDEVELANSFDTLMDSEGFDLSLQSLNEVGATDLSLFDAIVIGDDTGNSSQGGSHTEHAHEYQRHVVAQAGDRMGMGYGCLNNDANTAACKCVVKSDEDCQGNKNHKSAVG